LGSRQNAKPFLNTQTPRPKAGSFCRPLQKARRVCVRRRKKFQSFSPAACTAEKIHFGSQTCELCADGAQLVRCSELQSLQTRAQRSGSRLSACQNAFWHARSRLRLLFDIEPPHGHDVGHEGDGLDDHARIRARKDVIREPER